MTRQTTSIYTIREPEPTLPSWFLRVLTPREINAAITETNSMRTFRKLALGSGLFFQAQGTRVQVAAELYESKSREHNIGDPKSDPYQMHVVTLSITDLEHFFAQATWEQKFPKFRDGTPKPPEFALTFARAGRTGRKPAAMFTKITELTKEITECLS